MSFLAPGAFFLAVLLPVIIVLYLLKLRRAERIVSSTYLWQQMVRDVEANASWQRLQRNILLILQLLLLASLIISLARPSTRTQGFSSQAAIIIIDTSASMSATDIFPSRLQAAKDRAHRLIDDMPDNARFTLITAGLEAQVVVSTTADRQQAHQAIERIKPSNGASDLGVALQLASAVAARQPDTEIIILSDGRVTLPEHPTLRGNLRYLPIGTRSENQAISLINLEPAPGGQSLTAFAQVINYGDAPVSRRIAFYADGQLINAFDVDLPPASEQAVLTEGLPPTSRRVEARLTPDDTALDFLTLDDHAIAIHRQQKPSKVTLVSQGNIFLETALALLPNLEVTLVRPDQGAAYPAADLTIFDAYTPITTTLPQGNLLFIAPPFSTTYFTVRGLIEIPPIPKPTDTDDPLLRHVSLDSVNILDAVDIPLPGWAFPVIVAQGVTQNQQDVLSLVFRGEVDGRRIVVQAFDLHHSDLPLQVAFPILLTNLIEWLAPGYGGDIPTQVTPGAAVSFSIPVFTPHGDLPVVTITLPDGSSVKTETQDNQIAFADTNQLGIYQIRWNTEETPVEFAVNLFSPQESSLKPANTLPINWATTSAGNTLRQPAYREWWRSIALMALILLTVEWLVYQRATLAYIYKRLITGKSRQELKGGRNAT